MKQELTLWIIQKVSIVTDTIELNLSMILFRIFSIEENDMQWQIRYRDNSRKSIISAQLSPARMEVNFFQIQMEIMANANEWQAIVWWTINRGTVNVDSNTNILNFCRTNLFHFTSVEISNSQKVHNKKNTTRWLLSIRNLCTMFYKRGQ